MLQHSDEGGSIRHLALIGNFLPRKCGLATYTTDTFTALKGRFPDLTIDVYAMDDHPGRHTYPPEVTRSIPDQDRMAYLDAARAIEASGAQALWLQHEYGIFGGPAGDHILALLDRVAIPVIVTLHTVLEKPSADQRRVMEGLLRRAARVIVMAERGREILSRVYGASRNVVMIPHGVPDRDFIDPDALKDRFGWAGRKVVLTFGLLAPGKGIEVMIEALPAIVAEHPNVLYCVLGATHPNLVAHEGEAYRESLKARADRLGVTANIEFVDAFLEHNALIDYLQAADIYATPYLNPAQITSGTLSYAVGVGKAVVSTPYVHATEILADGHGVLVDFGDSAGFAREIIALLGNPDARRALSRRAYARGRTMIWPRLAERAMREIAQIVAAQPRRLPSSTVALTPLAPDFSAVERMSDATGMLQHAIYSIPDRRHGYCIDDNARALMLTTQMPTMDEAARDKWTTVYASFLQYAWNPEARRFRNFMNFDRTWCEDFGSEDSNGRALWALGVTARDAQLSKHRDWAVWMFDMTASLALELGSPRAQAFAMLGAAAILEAFPGHTLARTILARFAQELCDLLADARRPEWEWFEIVLAYDNARLPEALIRAGTAFGQADMVQRGLTTLAWIVGKQTSPDGRFRAVGSESFGRAYAEPLPFDQQPLEAQATIDACSAAFDATGDPRWVNEAERAYRWYLGQNDLDLPLATAQDGGCFDGLMPTGLNRNQGAELILALQLAGCTISGLAKRATSVAGARSAVA